MKVLIIDNNIDRDGWGSANLTREAVRVPGVTATIRRGPHDDLPDDWRAFDRVIISGSKTSCLDQAPWIDHLDEKIARALDAGVPMLGVCYGHQSIVRTIAGREALRKAEHAEFGWTEIRLQSQDSPLFKGLPKSFYSFSSHYEEVAQLPKGLTRLAESDDCYVQGYRVEGKPVFGIQFHPEKNLKEGEQIFLSQRQKGETQTMLRPKESQKLYRPEIGNQIFGNFIQGDYLK